MDFKATLSISALILALGGCAPYDTTPLIFGQSDTVGLSVGGSAAEQGETFVFGYKGHGIAIIPVTNKTGNLLSAAKEGDAGEVMSNGGSVTGEEDTFSVLGQFETEAEGGANSTSISLGKFFATGHAARTLADGFAEEMGSP